MTDKPKWMMEAAEEIDKYACRVDLVDKTEEESIRNITAIILKHCPEDIEDTLEKIKAIILKDRAEDKAAEKLVEIAKDLIIHKSEVASRGTWPHGRLREWGWVMRLIRIAEAALADHEKVNK